MGRYIAETSLFLQVDPGHAGDVWVGHADTRTIVSLAARIATFRPVSAVVVIDGCDPDDGQSGFDLAVAHLAELTDLLVLVDNARTRRLAQGRVSTQVVPDLAGAVGQALGHAHEGTHLVVLSTRDLGLVLETLDRARSRASSRRRVAGAQVGRG